MRAACSLASVLLLALAGCAAGSGDTDVLGMNFLSSLAGWRVEGRFLVLEA